MGKKGNLPTFFLLKFVFIIEFIIKLVYEVEDILDSRYQKKVKTTSFNYNT